MMKKLGFLAVLFLMLLAVPALAAGPELTFSLASGFYAYPMPLEMKCDQDAVIYYTLDGTAPDEDGQVYDGTLTLMWSNERKDMLTRATGITVGEDYLPKDDYPTAHVVRAVAITPDGKRSQVVSGTYFIGYDRAELYGDTAVMLLVTDPEGLFDYNTGIYVKGRLFDEWAAQQTGHYEGWQATANFTQRGDEWERAVDVTFLPAQGEGFSQQMGMRIKGGASRNSSQKSLRLIAREKYGEKNVDYAIYPDNVREEDGGVVEKYKSFTLRNGGNDADFARIRDPFIQNLATGLRFETAQNMPCIAFINGEYWGMYTLNEEYTDNYIQYHYGIDNKNVITVKVGQVDDGEEEDIWLFKEMFDYITEEDMSDPAKYEKAAGLLDMGSFSDYCALQFYIANEDGVFQNNNWEMWRVREPEADGHPYADGKWRMMLYDTDYSSGIYCDGGNATVDNITPVLTGTDYRWRHPALLLTSLIQNEQFQKDFAQACCDVRNLYFSQRRASAMLRAMKAEYLPYLPDSMRRFGPQWITWNAERHFTTELDQMGQFFSERPNHFLNVVKAALEFGDTYTVTIKINDAKKGQVFLNGRDIAATHNSRYKYFAECGLTATAVAAEGARFTGWTVSHEEVELSAPDGAITQVSFRRNFTLTANFE